MAQIIKRACKSFNGVDWDTHYFENIASQIKMIDGKDLETVCKNESTWIKDYSYIETLPGGFKILGVYLELNANTALTYTIPSGTFKEHVLPPLVASIVLSNAWQSRDSSKVVVTNWDKYKVDLVNYSSDKISGITLVIIGR